MKEKKLIYQLKKGSQKAFNEIYHMYSARLYAYCMQYTKSREDSEEIVQDVFIKLWLKKESIIQEDTVRSFIFKIAKNQLINRYKSRLNSFSFEEYTAYCNIEKFSTSDTSQIIEYDDFCRLLENAMKILSQTQKKVIEYRKFKHLTNQETADKLQLKEQTVKNQLSEGLKILRRELQKHLAWIIFLFLVK